MNPLKHIYWPTFEFLAAVQKLTAAREVFNKLPVDSIDIIYRNWHLQVRSKVLQHMKHADDFTTYEIYVKSNKHVFQIRKYIFYKLPVNIYSILLFVDWNRWAFSRWWECHSWIPVYKGLPGKFLCLSTRVGNKSY